MKIRIISIPVSNQEAAFQFYAQKLGFIKKHDIDLGNGHRWLTIVPQEDPEGPEVLLEPAPLHFEPAKVFQKALYDAGYPYTQFNVDNLDEEYKKLKERGVVFSVEPKDVGTAKIAILDDTCGNRIQLLEEY